MTLSIDSPASFSSVLMFFLFFFVFFSFSFFFHFSNFTGSELAIQNARDKSKVSLRKLKDGEEVSWSPGDYDWKNSRTVSHLLACQLKGYRPVILSLSSPPPSRCACRPSQRSPFSRQNSLARQRRQPSPTFPFLRRESITLHWRKRAPKYRPSWCARWSGEMAWSLWLFAQLTWSKTPLPMTLKCKSSKPRTANTKSCTLPKFVRPFVSSFSQLLSTFFSFLLSSVAL